MLGWRPEREGGALKLRVAVLVSVAVAVLAAAGGLAFAILRDGDDDRGPPSAVIVDQLSLTAPNDNFLSSARDALEGAGYRVDYVPGEQVTVEYYRNLPAQGYDIVLVRAHAGRRVTADELSADLFTSEAYDSDRHVEDQEAGRLKIGTYDEDAPLSEALFTIPAEFVSESMRGDFDGATVVLMGCDVLAGSALAAAFVDRGARAVVGWDDSVSAAHTDSATLVFLQNLLDRALPPEAAAAAAADEVGPDPYYGATLISYPAGG
jgi:hypothetical protein